MKAGPARRTWHHAGFMVGAPRGLDWAGSVFGPNVPRSDRQYYWFVLPCWTAAALFALLPAHQASRYDAAAPPGGRARARARQLWLRPPRHAGPLPRMRHCCDHTTSVRSALIIAARAPTPRQSGGRNDRSAPADAGGLRANRGIRGWRRGSSPRPLCRGVPGTCSTQLTTALRIMPEPNPHRTWTRLWRKHAAISSHGALCRTRIAGDSGRCVARRRWLNVSDPVVAKLAEEGKKLEWPYQTAGVACDATTGDVFMVLPGQGSGSRPTAAPPSPAPTAARSAGGARPASR